MTHRACPSSNRLVSETLLFLRASLGCGAAMFYWVEPDLSTTAHQLVGLPASLPGAYRRHVWRHDPLLTARLAQAQRDLAELEQEAAPDPLASAPYRAFLADYGVAGNVEYLFWAGDGPQRRPWGGISLLPLVGDARLSGQWPLLQATYRYVDLLLQGHAEARHLANRSLLMNRHGLTNRECDVCDLVAVGASNADIGLLLGLTTATIKSYMRRIFDKLGIDSRTALAARLSMPWAPH